MLSENGRVETLANSLAHVYNGEQPATRPRDLRLTPLLVAWQIQGRVLGLKALSADRTFSDQWWWSLWVNAVRISCFVCMKLRERMGQ
ncbi:hypothetical protein KSB_91930 [Ktedonobacter robiniae]|uniref:Transposase DDE domain-containing protein n=1 Tax=Ktedonobacter robiniae TaxID=2778365 RepID=A0ABQ3V6Y0_9CHLR|nr:hypothetical protein KSB_91930 [Ktedonobacter robiniae]